MNQDKIAFENGDVITVGDGTHTLMMYSASWCGSCQSVLENVDVDEHSELISDGGIKIVS